jgi:uncharacterized protein YecT (DUF1311 family)
MRALSTIMIAFALLAAPATPQTKEKWNPDGESICSSASTTADIVACLRKRSEFWDGRLNQSYQAVMTALSTQASDPVEAKKQQDRLRAAQRIWVQYRDANCGFYGSMEGSIRRILEADCVRRMTQDRAIELHEWGLQ